jgi:hypothetical protein
MKRLIKKVISFTALTLASVAILVSPASAQGDLLSGQSQYYTVVFRGNGEAIVYAKLVINNISDKVISDFSFQMPKAMPSELVIYQIRTQGRCLDYTTTMPSQPCTRFAEPDYSSQYYPTPSGSNSYLKISNYDKSGSRYTFALPTPVDPGRSTALVIAYAAQGYARKTLGGHKFAFETFRVASRLQQVNVSVDVDSDQLLKGKKSSVNYATSDIELGLSASSTATGLGSSAMDRAVGKIGTSGPIMKNAKSLAPDESLTVKGEYADSWFGLYWDSVLLTVLIIAALIVGLVFLMKFLKRRRSRTAHAAAPAAQAKTEKDWSVFNPAHVWISLVSVAATIGFAYLLPLLDRWFGSGVNDPVFDIVGAIAILLFFLIAIFGPPAYAGVKYGRKSFAVIFLADFLWMVLFLIIYFVLFRSGAIPHPVYPIHY